DLPGPTGERNTWRVHPRGMVLGLAEAVEDAVHQLAAALATGNRLAVPAAAAGWLSALPEALRGCVALRPSDGFEPWQAALLAGAEGRVAAWRRQLAAQPGPLRPILVADPDYVLERLLVERCVTVNTAATGGNAGLMGLGES
ncbi:MAG TPA: trifunctional transcriptional regulator/proline dehydrogenase/L-glutamate gamma-semialdehyde dehydrogenase, partial [Rhodocyclaceae bacterium]|nr:trifunctional transcriptional regulator/proline dehydrogenase/L-glutamate gamma-semialdehyde dehydrogenase [Rhodocyclaceae bacterium]